MHLKDRSQTFHLQGFCLHPLTPKTSLPLSLYTNHRLGAAQVLPRPKCPYAITTIGQSLLFAVPFQTRLDL